MNDQSELSPYRHVQLNFSAASRIAQFLLDDEDQVGDEPSLPAITGYRLERFIGAGAGGDVYLGYQDSSAEQLAIKILRHQLESRDAHQRAWRELDVLSDLKVPGVVALRGFGVTDGRLFIATSLVQGQSLDAYSRTRDLTLNERVELLAQIAEAAHRLHERGVIHRDLKPRNIIVQDDGQPTIIDLGIATLIQRSDGGALESNSAIGTLGFMSPEQARGDSHTLSVRADVFSLGAIGYVLLTGSTPHDLVELPKDEALRRVAQDEPRHPNQLDKSLSKSLAAILARAAAMKPDDRHGSAESFAADLRKWLAHIPIVWQNPSIRERSRLAFKRNPRAFAASGLAVVLFITTLTAISVAVAQASVAERERENAEQTRLIAKRESAFANDQLRFKEEWKIQAIEHSDALDQVRLREARLQQRRLKTIEMVKEFIKQGEISNAGIALVGLGEDIVEENLDDRAVIELFVATMHELIEEARSQHRTKE